VRRRLAAALIATISIAVFGCQALAAAPVGTEALPTISPLAASVIAPPQAVRGSDGRWHLVYEISLLNTSGAEQRIDRVDVVDGRGALQASFDGPEAVKAIMSDASHVFDPIDALPSSAGGTLWLDVTFARRGSIPPRLAHRITTTPLADDGSAEGPPATMVGVPTRVVRRQPVVIGPPLRGANYVNTNGCCGLGPHQRALFTFDGERISSQRFAIDWVRIDGEGRWWNGDPSKNESYVVFGAPIISVSAGTVVSTRSDLPQNTPPSPLANLDLGNALGNTVVVDIGSGRFAIYAHMLTVKVRVGQHVRRGQLLGQVGNSGASGAPHLHFQITDGLRGGGALSNGVPFEQTGFRLEGQILNFEGFLSQETSTAATLGPAPKQPLRHRQLPMQTDVVTFP